MVAPGSRVEFQNKEPHTVAVGVCLPRRWIWLRARPCPGHRRGVGRWVNPSQAALPGALNPLLILSMSQRRGHRPEPPSHGSERRPRAQADSDGKTETQTASVPLPGS